MDVKLMMMMMMMIKQAKLLYHIFFSNQITVHYNRKSKKALQLLFYSSFPGAINKLFDC